MHFCEVQPHLRSERESPHLAARYALHAAADADEGVRALRETHLDRVGRVGHVLLFVKKSEFAILADVMIGRHLLKYQWESTQCIPFAWCLRPFRPSELHCTPRRVVGWTIAREKRKN